ncbi:unnamed protein product, partial [Didymodactylos carnosus]
YIWSKFFKRYVAFRYLLIPVYVSCSILLYLQLYDRSLINVILLLVCILLATVLQKLLEFRYFILPYCLLRLQLNEKQSTKIALFLEILQATIINAVTIYVFCNKPFLWPDNENIQRFMW